MSNFSDRLKTERKRLKLTQVELARLVDVINQTVLAYEKGTREPTSGYLEKLANLGFDVMYLITGERDAPAPGADEAELLRLFATAPKATRDVVLGLLRHGLAPGGQQNGHIVNVQGNKNRVNVKG